MNGLAMFGGSGVGEHSRGTILSVNEYSSIYYTVSD